MRSRAYIVVDLGFGDAGKGSIVDYLSRRSRGKPVVVRFNGGPQAAHNVVTSDGKHHQFSQFGSGSFAGADTFLSRFMAIDPLSLRNEAEHLKEVCYFSPYEHLNVSENALVITPYHKVVNQNRELFRGERRHGSCGIGHGIAVEDSLGGIAVRAKDLKFRKILIKKLELISLIHNTVLSASPGVIADDMLMASKLIRIVPDDYLCQLSKDHDFIFEGAHGVLLDEWYGFHPYTTWSTCTPANALTLLDEIGFSGEKVKVGVTRTHMARHGPGPLPTEGRWLRYLTILDEKHNRDDRWQGNFRRGYLDTVLLRYAIKVSGGIDLIALTHLDWPVDVISPVCTGYEDLKFDAIIKDILPKKVLTDLPYQERLCSLLMYIKPVYKVLSCETSNAYRFVVVEGISDLLSTPVGILSSGPTHIDKEVMSVRGMER